MLGGENQMEKEFINEENKILTTIRGIDGEAVEIISWNTENPDAQPTKVKINLKDFMQGGAS